MADAMIERGEGTVITSTTNGAPNFIPLTHWTSAINVLQVRATIEMRGNSSGCQVTPAFRTSNDLVNLDDPVYFFNPPTYSTGAGFTYPTGYADISSRTAGRRYICFGLFCQPSSSGTIQSCWASLVVEILTQYVNLVSSAGRITAAGAVTNYVGSETSNNTASGDIGAGCNFAKNFPSNPSSIVVSNQNNYGVSTTAYTWNLQAGGVGIYHTVSSTGLAYMYETITAS